MKIGVWSFYSNLFTKNKIFKLASSGLGDDDLYGLNKLSDFCIQNKVDLITLDMVKNFDQLDKILVFDFPLPTKVQKYKDIYKKIIKFPRRKILVLHECEVIKPNNWEKKNHENWDKILTWNDEFIDNKKYFKLNMPPRKMNIVFKKVSFASKRFSTMICSNKKIIHKKELYSERNKCINYFEKNNLNDFDLYGYGWDKYSFPSNNLILNKLNRLNNIINIFKSNKKSWKGEIVSKKDVLPYYKYNFAYENAFNISGYILEKILDSFIYECVPIYLGAKNIQDHIPRNTFIDKRDFDSYETLYKYLKNLSEEDHKNYIKNIKKFLNSKEFYPFSVENYVSTIFSVIK
tara:strand:+ start:756 stop:1796 length:1041 start_codon:yes stop_codon:yes gene_type:complete